jgi:hypothetical protein
VTESRRPQRPAVDEDGTPWPLEFTCRLGWPAFNIELALHKNDPVAFLVGLASDASAPKQRQLDAVAVGVVSDANWMTR